MTQRLIAILRVCLHWLSAEDAGLEAALAMLRAEMLLVTIERDTLRDGLQHMTTLCESRGMSLHALRAALEAVTSERDAMKAAQEATPDAPRVVPFTWASDKPGRQRLRERLAIRAQASE